MFQAIIAKPEMRLVFTTHLDQKNYLDQNIFKESIDEITLNNRYLTFKNQKSDQRLHETYLSYKYNMLITKRSTKKSTMPNKINPASGMNTCLVRRKFFAFQKDSINVFYLRKKLNILLTLDSRNLI